MLRRFVSVSTRNASSLQQQSQRALAVVASSSSSGGAAGCSCGHGCGGCANARLATPAIRPAVFAAQTRGAHKSASSAAATASSSASAAVRSSRRSNKGVGTTILSSSSQAQPQAQPEQQAQTQQQQQQVVEVEVVTVPAAAAAAAVVAPEAPSSTPMAAPPAEAAGAFAVQQVVDEHGNVRVVLRQRLWAEHWGLANLYQLNSVRQQRKIVADMLENLQGEQLISIDERYRLPH